MQPQRSPKGNANVGRVYGCGALWETGILTFSKGLRLLEGFLALMHGGIMTSILIWVVTILTLLAITPADKNKEKIESFNVKIKKGR